MPQFTNRGIGLVDSITQDPFRPIEAGRVGISDAEALRTTTLAAGDALIVRQQGADYTAADDVAVTERTAAQNSYIPEAATGGDTTAMTVDTTVENGRVVSCVVRDVPDAQYSAGVEFTIDGNTGGSDDCVIMIP
jgi:hypothetical protein